MRGGYHAALNQLDVFERCPIHEQPLVDRCTCCGRSAPRFALSNPGNFPSWACNHCQSPIAGGAALENNLEAWRVPDNVSTIESFHRWTVAASSTVWFAAPPQWITCKPGNESDRRAAFAKVLLHITPWEAQSCFRELDIEISSLLVTTYRVAAATKSSYHRFAGAILPSSTFRTEFWDGWATADGGVRLPVDLGVSCELHAAYIWRCQFENVRSMGFQGRLGVPAENAFDAVIKRWLALLYTRYSVVLNDEVRYAIAQAVWRAAYRIAQAWRDHLARADEVGKRPIINHDWLARLGRWHGVTGLPLGLAIHHPGAERYKLYLFVC